jgi:hypothetical protein
MKKNLFCFLAFVASIMLITSCTKEDSNDEELITTVTYNLTPVGGGSAVTLSFRDIDGDGGNAPVVSVSPLKANTVYNGELTILNESESPVDDITTEIKAEDKEHQFFFESSVVKVEYTDKDANGNPLGLLTKVSTTAAGTGKLKVTLKHEPNKTASGVKDGKIANAGGETDIEVEFNITVQ